MRAIWKGSLSFGLIAIPVSLYSATRREEMKFRLLRGSDLSPVNYKRVAEADGMEVPWDQIVKGYEYEKGKFVVLREDDFKRVDVEATQTVEITDFVSLSEINPMHFNKPFYLEPAAKGGTRAYVLLREALREEGKVGIAKVVIKSRQYLAAVKPAGDVLTLELMHFADELVSPDSLKLPHKVELHKGELGMAKLLIQQMTDKWNPEKYGDDYEVALRKLIDEKVEQGDKAGPRQTKAKAKPPQNVINLMDVLEQSLRETKKGKKAPAPGAAKPARRKAA